MEYINTIYIIVVDRWYTSNCNTKLRGLVCMKQNGSDVVQTTPTTVMQPWGCPSGFIESQISKISIENLLSSSEALLHMNIYVHIVATCIVLVYCTCF
jgi:hypothetical protein